MTRDEWIVGFWRRVVKLGSRQCWLWAGHRDEEGYGQLKREDNQTSMAAHRAAIEILRGIRVPAHLVVMHTCDNPPCVNPYHLRVGTQLQNMQDMRAKGRARTVVFFGDEHAGTKICDADVPKIRQRYAERHLTHTTQQQLAAEYGVSQAQISRILNRKRRK